MSKLSTLALWCALLAVGVGRARGQTEPGPAPTADEEGALGWANQSELSFVATYGNAEAETLRLQNLLRYRWPKARYTLRVDGLRASNADQKFVEVLELPDSFEGIDPRDLVVLVDPEKEIDAEKYLIENIYDRTVSERLFWNVGFTWDRNQDANILNRYVAFFGLGNVWWNRDDARWETTYGASYTDRNEETPDPEKDAEFPGLRLASTAWKRWGITRVGHDWRSNANLTDAGDWNLDTTAWCEVSINRLLALKVSLQWLYNSRPALEEIDVVALLPEGVEIDFGNVDIRKEKSDTIFNTSIVFRF